ncbi:GNAT family N-acetyltransferase [Streptomyces abyssomicinicus]|uniref:GNAT family N-acetyltransferase n=1 Tax=Streptomyces abyssomicinicus TaxID=574929 RepID=UPI001FE2E81C|nr:GNAT family N-acetyltransferase [Streptomyces abyssomicinicus]
MGQEVQVRPGTEEDLTGLTDIYNHYVCETPYTFDTLPFPPGERRAWLAGYSARGPHRLLVAEDAGTGTLLGYATSGRFRPKPAYLSSVECTVYLAPGATGRGVGGRLYRALFDALADEDVHRAYAAIVPPNEPSERLHRRFGFEQVGLFREVGWKFGRYWDVAWFEKRL